MTARGRAISSTVSQTKTPLLLAVGAGRLSESDSEHHGCRYEGSADRCQRDVDSSVRRRSGCEHKKAAAEWMRALIVELFQRS